MFDGTDQDFVKQRTKEEITDPKLGTVAQVYEHIEADDDSNFECDVLVDGTLFEERAIPYLGAHSSQISPPMVGEQVLIIFREGENSRPILVGTGYTNRSRSPTARAGMYRDVYDAGYSPVGGGDIQVTGYTQYSENPSISNPDDLSVEKTWYQVAKDAQTADPSFAGEAPMLMGMYDSPPYAEDESVITLEGNVVDNNSSQSMNVTLDFKDGTIEAKAENSTGEFGFSIDVKSGEFTLIDQSGYGIESDGDGNFTWHHKSIEMSEGTTTSL